MADGRRGIERPEAVQAHLHEAAVGLFPIKRGGPALRFDRGPAVGEPQRRRAVAAVLDEGDPLGIGDATIGEPEGTDELIVSRPFIVIGKALAVMANGKNAAVESDPVERRRLRHRDAGGGAGVSRLQRLAREQAQDVGEQKLLMLLLVIDAELDQLSRPGLKATLAKPLECRVDMLAIGAHLVGRRARQETALAARLPGTHALVIGIEAIFEALVENPVALEEGFEHESFEEPGGVGEMPFGGTCVVIGLDDLVLVAQGERKFRGKSARGDQALEKRLGLGPMNVVEDGITRAHNPLLGNRTLFAQSGQAEQSSQPFANARFSSLFHKAEWVSMHKPVKAPTHGQSFLKPQIAGG